MNKIRNYFVNGFIAITVLVLVLQIQGCDTNSTNPNGSTVSLSFATSNSLNKTNYTSIELDTVKILIRDVKLENEFDSSEYESLSKMYSDGDHYRSEYVKVGPFVVYLNLAGVTTDFAVNNIPAGSYDEIKFKIHQLEASEVPPDPEFKDGDDESQRYSVIVKGTYNSEPFIYKSRKSAHQKIRLDSLLQVEENSVTNLTITVDPNTWFMNGDTELDPTDSTNSYIIDNNIARSFSGAFKDDNHDGKCDDNQYGEHHHH